MFLSHWMQLSAFVIQTLLYGVKRRHLSGFMALLLPDNLNYKVQVGNGVTRSSATMVTVSYSGAYGGLMTAARFNTWNECGGIIASC